MKWKQLLVVLTLSAVCPYLQGQTTLQVVTKKIEKSFPFREGYQLNIEGQKAAIDVNTWARNEIKIEIAIEAGHPDRAVAATDVEKIEYLATRVKNNIYLRNYLSDEAGDPASILNVRYTITVPEDCPIYVKNHLGTANLKNLTNRLKINASFTQIGLEQISGLIDIYTRFGDLIGQDLNARAFIESRRSDIQLNNIRGNFDIKAHYGVVKVFAHPALATLKIDAEKADVFAYASNPESIAYDLQTYAANLSSPNDIDMQQIDRVEQEQKVSFRPNQENFSLFQINIRFGELKIARVRKP